MGMYWCTPRIPYVERRAAFLSRVAGPAVAALEAFFTTPKQIQGLHRGIVAVGRRALRGAATKWHRDRRRSIPALRVLQLWRVASLEIELRARGPKWRR
eukprot:8886748-Pyramimonas_sp.AAC.1